MSPYAPGIITVDRVGRSTWIVELLGEHEITNADRLGDELVAILVRGTSVLVDPSAATFIDSAIVGKLVAAQQGVDELPTGHLAVVAPSSSFPARVLALLHTETVFKAFETRQDGLAWLEASETT